LEEILRKKRGLYKRAIIVSESIFSMDGDIADIDRLIELKNKYDCLLMIDEAHAFCTTGKNLAGVVQYKDVDIITATFGKAVGSFGAFCVADKHIISYLTNKARSFIFSTSIPPINIAWTNWLLTEKINYLKFQKDKLNKLISNINELLPAEEKLFSQIMPIVIGKNEDTVKIVYVGSLEKSYDLTTVIKAVSKCEKVQLIVIGDGSRRKELEDLALETNANCIFLGYLPYSEMITKISECNVAVNPIHKGSAGSIINKVGDYAMAGLPVINTQEAQEYRDLVDEYNCGINCRCENVDDVISAINILVQNKELRTKMSNQSRKLGEKLFAREVTYQKIVDLIENI
jgi:7-keto-8-aminopelargonate synthetase-like enzyme